MRQLALSSRLFSRFKLSQAIRHIALAGYAGIEIVADIPHGYPPTLSETDRRGIHGALTQSHLAVSNINASPMTALRDEIRPSWIEADPILREERIHHTLDAGRLAKDIGAPTVTTLGGGQLEGAMTRETAIAHFVAGLRHVAAIVAKGKCPPVLICPRPGLLIQTADDALAILEQVGTPNIAVDFNTAYSRCAGEDPVAAIKKLGRAIRHVHLADCSADDAGAAVVPGTGIVDFAAVFSALEAIHYTGWFTVDLSGADAHPDDAAKQAVQFLGRFQT